MILEKTSIRPTVTPFASPYSVFARIDLVSFSILLGLPLDDALDHGNKANAFWECTRKLLNMDIIQAYHKTVAAFPDAIFSELVHDSAQKNLDSV